MATDTRTYQTRHGPMIGLAGDRFISRSLEVYGEFSAGEWQILEQLVKPGMTVVEVGANIGTHSVPLARRCFPGPLYLFEPQQRVFQILCANLANNGITNAIAYPDAMGDEPGFVVVPPLDYAAEANFGGVEVRPDDGATVGLKVRVISLDSLELAACHVLKIDVEGFEPQVLEGAVYTIARCRPLIYIENDRPSQQQDVIDRLTNLGYRLYWHTPPLFQAGNFNAVPADVFGNIVSLNMLCMPMESGHVVQGIAQIDPTNWVSPTAKR